MCFKSPFLHPLMTITTIRTVLPYREHSIEQCTLRIASDFLYGLSPGSHCCPHPADHGTPAEENKPHGDWNEQTVSAHRESLLLASVITSPFVIVEFILLGDVSVQQWFMKSSFRFLQGFCATQTWLLVVFWDQVLGYKWSYSSSSLNRVTVGCDVKFLWALVYKELGFNAVSNTQRVFPEKMLFCHLGWIGLNPEGWGISEGHFWLLCGTLDVVTKLVCVNLPCTSCTERQVSRAGRLG